MASVLADHADWQVELIDIADSDGLIERYGQRIPVLACEAGELDWPFDAKAVCDWVGQAGQA